MVWLKYQYCLLFYFSCKRKVGYRFVKKLITAYFHGSGWKCSIGDAGFSFYCNEVKLTCLDSAEKDTADHTY